MVTLRAEPKRLVFICSPVDVRPLGDTGGSAEWTSVAVLGTVGFVHIEQILTLQCSLTVSLSGFKLFIESKYTETCAGKYNVACSTAAV